MQEAVRISDRLIKALPFDGTFPQEVHLLGRKEKGEGAWTIIYYGKNDLRLSVVIYFPDDRCRIDVYSEGSERLHGVYNRDGTPNPELLKKYRSFIKDPFKEKEVDSKGKEEERRRNEEQSGVSEKGSGNGAGR